MLFLLYLFFYEQLDNIKSKKKKFYLENLNDEKLINYYEKIDNSKNDNIILVTLIGKIVNLFVFNEFEKKSMIISLSSILKKQYKRKIKIIFFKEIN